MPKKKTEKRVAGVKYVKGDRVITNKAFSAKAKFGEAWVKQEGTQRVSPMERARERAHDAGFQEGFAEAKRQMAGRDTAQAARIALITALGSIAESNARLVAAIGQTVDTLPGALNG